MTTRLTQRQSRQRKLSTKINLKIVRESDLVDHDEAGDDDLSRHIPRVETGVEKAEETEHHLQLIIAAAQAAALGTQQAAAEAAASIPVPEIVASGVQYERLYEPNYVMPSSYIRFSSTVEDSAGCPYCMNADDDAFLKTINTKYAKKRQCSEDMFEEIMNFFENQAAAKQPFSAVGNAEVLSFEELISDPEAEKPALPGFETFWQEVYTHWKLQRTKRANGSLMPDLKFEKNVDTDDQDPYVCFRRREIRQTRKTRGRDAQVTEKLRTLRLQLESARAMLADTRQRDLLLKEQNDLGKKKFAQRHDLKVQKRERGIKDDDELLIDQKPQPKPKPRLDQNALQRGPPGTIPQAMKRYDGRPIDSELVSHEEEKAKKDALIEQYIEESMVKHKRWNEAFHDNTWRPITPPLENRPTTYRAVESISFLPTPPSSESEDAGRSGKDQQGGVPMTDVTRRPVQISYADPSTTSSSGQAGFRTRRGRNGRMWVDRVLKRPREQDHYNHLRDDRAAFDVESDDDDEMYEVDPNGPDSIRYRVHLATNQLVRETQLAMQAHMQSRGRFPLPAGAMLGPGGAAAAQAAQAQAQALHLQQQRQQQQ
ncbi:hypothetical protein K402DRAFT_394259 [Aulographum hederae CBS 113979]|uniref:Enhancer of polycomb-like protein n=1 Tax=Aulographum hederae CBS 113979 TaxID=1176131 RepID=A0A6G1GYX6_9PEZI|nr:hypothetical protein K402DRAFT_394259 [Aulographum hederae CBS 113979]